LFLDISQLVDFQKLIYQVLYRMNQKI